jgi:hypothetical protein
MVSFSNFSNYDFVFLNVIRTELQCLESESDFAKTGHNLG